MNYCYPKEELTMSAGSAVGHSEAKRLRPMFITGTIETEASGIARIICELANAVDRQGGDVSVYTVNCSGRKHTTAMLDDPDRCVSPPGHWAGRLAWSPALRRQVEKDVKTFDVVHCHSLWMLPNHYACQSARRNDVPIIFTAHGYLEPWALARSRWKKRLVGSLFQDRDLRHAACIHVNTLSEMESIRDYGLRNPVAVIPNGVRLGDRPSTTEDFLAKRTHLKECRIALFLSRLHEKKGLGHLVKAWSLISEDFADWQLVIAGPDDGYQQSLQTEIDRLSLKRVSLTGPLYGEEKLAAQSAAEIFVLPSFSEGFSMAILEAMAAELPVLITPGCNFPEVSDRGAGVIVEPTVEDTVRGLRELCSKAPEDLSEMGRCGRDLVLQKYTWDQVASDFLSLYEWVLGSKTPPEFVHFA